MITFLSTVFMLFPGVQLSRVTRYSLLSQLSSAFSPDFFGVVPSILATIRIILVFTFQSPLSSHARSWYLSTLLLLLLYPYVSWHCDRPIYHVVVVFVVVIIIIIIINLPSVVP